MVVKQVASDGEFNSELQSAAGKCVIADFFATWCGPCRNIAPIYEQLSNKYPQARFLKVDVDKLPTTAQSQGVSAMPTFLFFLNGQKVDTLRGADPQQLEAKIQKWAESSGSGEESAVPGQMDLTGLLSKKDVECLNEADDQTLGACLTGSTYLESDCDAQLIINLPFTQPVKCHSIQIKGPPDCGPKNIKLFINLPMTLDFDSAEQMEPIQAFELTPEQVDEGEIIPLRYVKYQNVSSIQIFVADNQIESDVTKISELKIYGTPLNATNMQDFKRIAGKKGEAH